MTALLLNFQGYSRLDIYFCTASNCSWTDSEPLSTGKEGIGCWEKKTVSIIQ